MDLIVKCYQKIIINKMIDSYSLMFISGKFWIKLLPGRSLYFGVCGNKSVKPPQFHKFWLVHSEIEINNNNLCLYPIEESKFSKEELWIFSLCCVFLYFAWCLGSFSLDTCALTLCFWKIETVLVKSPNLEARIHQSNWHSVVH